MVCANSNISFMLPFLFCFPLFSLSLSLSYSLPLIGLSVEHIVDSECCEAILPFVSQNGNYTFSICYCF